MYFSIIVAKQDYVNLTLYHFITFYLNYEWFSYKGTVASTGGAIKPKEIGYDVFTISLDTLHLISRNLLVLPLFPFLDAKTIII